MLRLWPERQCRVWRRYVVPSRRIDHVKLDRLRGRVAAQLGR
jgi:hypothetical protein